MKLHELKQKRNTIAAEMRALHDSIPENTVWSEEQNKKWNDARSQLQALDERIGREEELRRQDQTYVDDQEPELRAQQTTPEKQADERRAAAFDRFLRNGFAELTAEERQAIKELRAQEPHLMIKVAIPSQLRCVIPSLIQ